MNRRTKVIVFLVSALIGFLLVSGCESSGFDKRATLMPDRIGISISRQRYRDGPADGGITFNMQWDLK